MEASPLPSLDGALCMVHCRGDYHLNIRNVLELQQGMFWGFKLCSLQTSLYYNTVHILEGLLSEVLLCVAIIMLCNIHILLLLYTLFIQILGVYTQTQTHTHTQTQTHTHTHEHTHTHTHTHKHTHANMYTHTNTYTHTHTHTHTHTQMAGVCWYISVIHLCVRTSCLQRSHL